MKNNSLRMHSQKLNKSKKSSLQPSVINQSPQQPFDYNIGENEAVELSLQRFSIFNLQDDRVGHYDVTFQFGSKKLFAHSFILWSASETFQAMLFGSWATKDPIPITGHSYEDFKEFLTYLYLGQCKVNYTNVMSLVDLAESYGVTLLKEKCDKFLTNTQPTMESVFRIYENLKLYSLEMACEKISEFIMANTYDLLQCKHFLNVKKETILDIVQMENLAITEEELFKAVYTWGLHLCEIKLGNQNLQITQDMVKEELDDILPFIRFPVMNLNFLHNYVVPKGYLFSSFDELGKVLCDATAFANHVNQSRVNHANEQLFPPRTSRHSNKRRGGCRIELTDRNSKKAFAFIKDENVIKVLQPYKNNQSWAAPYGQTISCYWNYYRFNDMTSQINISPTEKESKIYLIRNINGMLGIKYLPERQRPGYENRDYYMDDIRSNNGVKDVIIAKVFPEDESFSFENGCKLDLIE